MASSSPALDRDDGLFSCVSFGLRSRTITRTSSFSLGLQEMRSSTKSASYRGRVRRSKRRRGDAFGERKAVSECTSPFIGLAGPSPPFNKETKLQHFGGRGDLFGIISSPD